MFLDKKDPHLVPITFVSSFNGKFSVIVSLSVLISGAPANISLYPSS